jgi:hypothetical protein
MLASSREKSIVVSGGRLPRRDGDGERLERMKGHLFPANIKGWLVQ